MAETVHTFHALAFVENFSLKELVTDIARDKRLVSLEVSIVLLIVLEIALRFVGH